VAHFEVKADFEEYKNMAAAWLRYGCSMVEA